MESRTKTKQQKAPMDRMTRSNPSAILFLMCAIPVSETSQVVSCSPWLISRVTTTILIVLVIVKKPWMTLAWCLHNPQEPGKHPEQKQMLWQVTGRDTQRFGSNKFTYGQSFVLLQPRGHFNRLQYHGQSECCQSAVQVNDRGRHHVQACHSATHLSNVLTSWWPSNRGETWQYLAGFFFIITLWRCAFKALIIIATCRQSSC
jgi:hypothetical protein